MSIDRERWNALARRLAVPGFLLLLTWCAHFALAHRFGFYDDDESFAVPTLAWRWRDAWHYCVTQITQFPFPQGRPVGFIIGSVGPFIGYRIAGVYGMYMVGCGFVAANAILLHRLMKQTTNELLAFIAAVLFVLFPADTTRPYLCHNTSLQPALTFMLIAGLMWVSDLRWKRVAAYAVAALCLLTYETGFLPFLAIPLLTFRNDRRWWVRFVIHGIICGILPVAVVALRHHLGESRANDAYADPHDVLLKIANGLWMGPAASLYAFGCRSWKVLSELGEKNLQAVLIAAVVLSIATWRFLKTVAVGSEQKNDRLFDSIRATLFGAAALSVSYAFSFTHYPPTARDGLGTSVHMAAAIGASVLAAVLISMGVRWMLARRARIATSILLGVVFSLLFGFCLDIQQGFADTWTAKRKFWSRVIDLCPDIRDGTLIICEGYIYTDTYVAPVNGWSDVELLQMMFRWPKSMRTPPELASFPLPEMSSPGARWQDYLVYPASGGPPVWRKAPWGLGDDWELPVDNLILLRVDGRAHISRLYGNVDVHGRAFALKLPTGIVTYPGTPFFKLLSGRSSSARVEKYVGWKPISGIGAPEGPYPELEIPVVRCGNGEKSILEVMSKTSRKMVLEFTACPILRGQQITVHVNGDRLARIELPSLIEYTPAKVEFRARPGVNRIELSYKLPPSDKPDGTRVMYEELKVTPAL